MIRARQWQQIEGAVLCVAGLVIFAQLDSGISWWGALLLFFAPDLSFAAYLAGPRLGAMAYNLWHLYGLGLALLAAGMGLSSGLLAGLGALWLAHAGFDRMLGYGLKLPTGFHDTHLGKIGQGNAKR